MVGDHPALVKSFKFHRKNRLSGYRAVMGRNLANLIRLTGLGAIHLCIQRSIYYLLINLNNRECYTQLTVVKSTCRHRLFQI